MGLEILPPDVNRSEAYFTVAEGKIVYGLLGIKGVGEGLARAIVAEREKRGGFGSFIDFVERLGTQAMNKKTLECLASAGCFDGLGRGAEGSGGTCTRRELVMNIERAVDYAAAKEEAGRFGQASLFEGSGEEEYPPFCLDAAEEFPRAEILRMEKELLGFYFSGHPMDEWRKLWERCSDANLEHPERSSPDRTYTLIAMLTEFREILTKTGRKMAFGAVENPGGSIEIVVFADTLERFRERFAVDQVLCLRGKIDTSRDRPSFKVEDFADPESLAVRSWQEVHLRLGGKIEHDEDLYELREAILDAPGGCQVFFHLGEGGSEATVKAHAQITCSADEATLEKLRAAPRVLEVWRD